MADTNNIQEQYEGNLARQSSGYDEHLYDVLSEMSKNLEKIARASVDSSQGTSRSRLNDESRRAAREMDTSRVGRREKKKAQNPQVRGGWDGFFDGIEDAVFGDFKKSLKSNFKKFSDDLAEQLGGVTKEAIPNALGEKLAQAAMNSLKQSKVGKRLTSAFGEFGTEISKIANAGMDAASEAIKAMNEGVENNSEATTAADEPVSSRRASRSSARAEARAERSRQSEEFFSMQSQAHENARARMEELRRQQDEFVESFQFDEDTARDFQIENDWFDVSKKQYMDMKGMLPDLPDYNDIFNEELAKLQEQAQSGPANQPVNSSQASQQSREESQSINIQDLADAADNAASHMNNASTSMADDMARSASNIANASQSSASGLGQAASNLAGQVGNAGANISSATQAASSAMSGAAKGTLGQGMKAFASTFSKSGASLLKASGLAAKGLVALGPYAVAAVAVIAVMKQLSKVGQALKEGFQALSEGVKGAANRGVSSQRKALELEKKRLAEDVNTLIEEPFNNLKAASDALCSAWENNIAVINATQGYTKAGMQDLISNYASRLRSEGLSSVVSSADITSNLENVIKSGLSGAAAEEFAYMATVLQEAVPNQDFFSYASTYAAIAANATKEGLSQKEALAKANSEMEQFASNVLYASRQLSGGFSTGLQNTSELFSDSFKIIQSARSGDMAQVSGVLTSVAGIIGAIAPDLSSSLVESVVSAAIGGNSDTNVALRSLAGVNASNTQFLKALADDPKKIFSNLFNNLAEMQNSGQDNFMEVAEGLSDVFGVSMESLARVDFNYLASAISSMSVNNSSLQDNLSLLADGQTKTTTEQLKIAEINKLMIDEGLSYVLDNEAARAIQQHMWDEQLALEMQEATYAVELKGGAMTFLEKINEAVKFISTILNPIGALMDKITNLAATSAEAVAQNNDIKKLLELGNVGKTNKEQLHNLTTRGKRLNLTESLVTQMGGFSAYDSVSKITAANNAMNAKRYKWTNIIDGFQLAGKAINAWAGNFNQSILGSTNNQTAARAVTSSYQWGMVSKSIDKAIRATTKSGAAYYSEAVNTSVAKQVNDKAQVNFQNFLDTMRKFVDEGKSYEEWKATATRYGISNLSEAIEDFGLTEAGLEGKFKEFEAGQQAEKQYQRQQTEDMFWKESIEYFKNTAPTFHDKLLTAISKFYKKYESFYSDWIDYYIKHTAYSSETLDAYKVEQILNADKNATGDAVNALADALLSNAVDLKDPAVQTNVLLSQMLVTLNAILQQNTKTNNSVLPTSLSALGLGLVSNV